MIVKEKKDFMICLITGSESNLDYRYMINGNRNTIDKGVTIEEYENIDGNNVVKSRMFLTEEVMAFLGEYILDKLMLEKMRKGSDFDIDKKE